MSLKFWAYAALYIGWGTTFLAIKVGIESVSPSTFLALRYYITALCLLPFCISSLIKLINFNNFKWVSLQAVGLLVCGIYPMAVAEQAVPSNITACLIAITPITFLIFEKFLNTEKFNSVDLIAITLGLFGVYILNSAASMKFGMDVFSLTLIIVAVISWSVTSVKFKTYKSGLTLVGASTLQYLVAGTVLTGISIFNGEQIVSELQNISTRSWMAIAYISLVPSIITYLSYLWLLENEPAQRVATFAYVNPLVASVAGWLILGESLFSEMIIAMGLILLSTFITFNKEAFAKRLKQMSSSIKEF